MKRCIFVVLILAFAYANPVLLLAQERKKAKAAKEENQASSAEKTKQEKDILIANINGLRNHELRVAILQQVLSEEVAKLRNLEAVFSDTYKLDLEKFRKGIYRYDDKSGKITEQPAPAEKK